MQMNELKDDTGVGAIVAIGNQIKNGNCALFCKNC